MRISGRFLLVQKMWCMEIWASNLPVFEDWDASILNRDYYAKSSSKTTYVCFQQMCPKESIWYFSSFFNSMFWRLSNQVKYSTQLTCHFKVKIYLEYRHPKTHHAIQFVTQLTKLRYNSAYSAVFWHDNKIYQLDLRTQSKMTCKRWKK